ncbi:MAG: SMC-Scp complex subunit ScpB, partial [Pirellulaceae bacterium]|nr:SMC-Scp complex subunit ScpB [Pirellulaceae bacterium]
DRSSGAILSQLVRRKILRIEQQDEKPRTPRYFTGDRFLDLFGLETIDDLPQTYDHEKIA